MLHFRIALLICSYKVKMTQNIWERLLMMRKSLYFTNNQITKKWNNKIVIEIIIFKMKELFVPFFVHFSCTLDKMFPNYIKEMQINWKSFVIVRDTKFHIEIRVFWMFIWLFDYLIIWLRFVWSFFNLSFGLSKQDV